MSETINRDAFNAIDAQCDAAIDQLHVESQEYLHLPWRDLDEMVGGLIAPCVWFVGGFSGNGKTTFLMNCTWRLLEQDYSVLYVGTETQPNELRTKLACLRQNIYAGDVFTGRAAEWGDWGLKRGQLVDDINRQRRYGPKHNFLVYPVEDVRRADIIAAFHNAEKYKADLIVIDHIDDISHGDTHSGYEDMQALTRLVLNQAKQSRIPVLVATQFNNEAVKGDVLGQYQPPQPHHVLMGGRKRQIAWGMLGLYRPLRSDLTDAEVRDARARKLKPHEFLVPNALNVLCMKHRHYGSREGDRITLAFDHGRLLNMERFA